MQTWITELKQLGPQNIVLAITGNKSDLEEKRKVCTWAIFSPPPCSCLGIILAAPACTYLPMYQAFVLCQLQVSRATGEAFAKNSNALFMETSAKDGSNVHDLFRAIGIKIKCLCNFVYYTTFSLSPPPRSP